MARNDFTTPKPETIKGAATSGRIMSELWERTADQLSQDELEWFANSNEYTRMQARNLSEVIEGIGCLISSDEQAGNFQSNRDITTLLFTFAHQVDTIAGMMDISDSAQHRLANPKSYEEMRKAMAQA